jgi:phytoene dehydrogenase-like protein
MNRSKDVIVIGGGIAGLSAAAHLAKMGKKVIVFEQHDKPGGYYTSFSRKGIVFDITAHWTIAHEQVNEMLAGLGAPPIAFVHHPNIGQYFGPGAKGPILLVNDRKRFEHSILDAYPSAKKESIDRLIELSLKAEAEIRNMQMQSPELMSMASKARMMVQLPFKLRTVMKYSKTPGEELLKSLFPGDDLSGLRAALYMLAPIKNFSAIGMLLYIAFALRGSAYQPDGGALKAAEAFAEAAAHNGAAIRYNQKVRSIRVEQGRVGGVTLEDGESVEADYVVSAADIRQTFYKLINPALVPPDIRKKLENTPVSGTFVILSIVTDIDPATYGLNGIDAFYTDTADINEALTPDDPEHSMISIQFPEFHELNSDSRLYGIQLVAPASFEYKEHWATGPGFERTDEYRKLKEDFAGRLIARAEKAMLGLRQHVISIDIATPISMQRYTLNDLGSPVGWSYTSTERWKQKVKFIEGLYLAGHWVGPSGIYNVAVSGRNAAELIAREG